ncbi:MAG: SCO family protein, partial [Myxococcota bacterium]
MPLIRPLLVALLLGGLAPACADPAPVADAAPRPAPDLRGTRHDGTDFRLDALRGRVVALVFGYASCPDVCPMTL